MEISALRYKKITTVVANCKKLLNTNDPFKICKLLGINVRSVPLSLGLCGFVDVKQIPADTFNHKNGQLCTVDATIFLSTALDSYSQKIVCAHELGHVLVQYNESLNLFESNSENSKIKEYEANLFAIELLPQIYTDSNVDYRALTKEELQRFMNKKVSHSFFVL